MMKQNVLDWPLYTNNISLLGYLKILNLHNMLMCHILTKIENLPMVVQQIN